MTAQAVSGWERDEAIPEERHFPVLRRLLRVSYKWLHEGGSDVPAPNDPAVLFDDMTPSDQAVVGQFLQKMSG